MSAQQYSHNHGQHHNHGHEQERRNYGSPARPLTPSKFSAGNQPPETAPASQSFAMSGRNSNSTGNMNYRDGRNGRDGRNMARDTASSRMNSRMHNVSYSPKPAASRRVNASAMMSPASTKGRFMSSAGLILQQFEQQDQQDLSRSPRTHTQESSTVGRSNMGLQSHVQSRPPSLSAALHAPPTLSPTTTPLAPMMTATLSPGLAAAPLTTPAPVSPYAADQVVHQAEYNDSFHFNQPHPPGPNANANNRRYASGGGASSASTISTLSLDSLDTSIRSNGTPDYHPPQAFLMIPGNPATTTVIEEVPTNSAKHAASRHNAASASSVTCDAKPMHARHNETNSIHSAPPTVKRAPGTSAAPKAGLQKFDHRLRTMKAGSTTMSNNFVAREKQFRIIGNAMTQIFKAHAKSSAVPTEPTTRTPMPTAPVEPFRRRHSMKQQQRPFVGRTKSNDEDILRAMMDTGGAAPVTSTVMQNAARPQPRSWVVMSGPTGCGKSTLLSHVVKYQKHQQQLHGFFVHISLSLHHKDQPLATIHLFVLELCQQILNLPKTSKLRPQQDQTDPRRFQDLQHDLQSSLGIMERTVLSKILPKHMYDAIFARANANGKNSASSTNPRGNAYSNNATTASNNNKKKNNGAGNANGMRNTMPEGSSSLAEWRYQFQNALIQFLFVVSTYCPVIWISENLQYSDAPSIDLMMTMIQNTTLPHLGIITCHCTSVTQSPILRNMYQKLDQSKRTRSIRLVFVEMDNISQDQTHEWLDTFMGTTSSTQISELAEYLHEMTNGNFYFLEQYLRALLQMEMMHYQTDTKDYMLQDNVPSIRRLLRKRMKHAQQAPSILDFCKYQLSGTIFTSPTAATLLSLRSSTTNSIKSMAKHVLSLIACLGTFTISHSMIQLILNGFCGHRTAAAQNEHEAFFQQYFEISPSLLADSTKLNAIMKICQEEGWMTELSSAQGNNLYNVVSTATSNAHHVDRYYQFTHETIQEAAAKLISESKLSELQFRMGDIMFQEYGSTNPNLVFLITNLMNIRLDMLPRNDTAKRYAVSQLNHVVGQRAITSCCSFLAAAEHYKIAIRLLPNEMDASAYAPSSATDDPLANVDIKQVSCQYYSNAAECAQCNQNYEQMRLYCGTVMGMITNTPSSKRTTLLLDHIRVYHTFMDSILQQLSNIDPSFMAENAANTKTMTVNGVHNINMTSAPASKSVINTHTNTSVSTTMNPLNATTTSANGEVYNVIDMGIEILSQLGVSFQKGNLNRTVRGILNTKISVERISPELMETLQYVRADEDPVQQAVMKTLDKVILASYYMKPEFMPNVITRSVRRTLQSGITNDSPPAFALLGLLLTYFTGDFSMGTMYAENAVGMIQRGKGVGGDSSDVVGGPAVARRRSSFTVSSTKDGAAASLQQRRSEPPLEYNRKSNDEDAYFHFTTECRTMYICYGMVLNWTRPWETCREPLLDAYHVGMASGDVESAMWCMYYYLDSSWNTGSSLIALDRDFSTYTKVCQDTNQSLQYMCLAMNWQVVLNLSGMSSSNRRTVLTGDAFDERVILRQLQQRSVNGGGGNSGNVVGSASGSISLLQMILYRYKLYAALYFGEWDVAFSIGSSIMDDYCKKLPGQSGCIFVTYISGLAAFAASKFKSKDKKYKRHGRKCRDRLKAWADKGNPNCVHYVAMLDGEQEASRGMLDTASKFFESAIRLAGRRGIPQDQAIAHERLAEAWLYHGDSDNAKYHFLEALRLYGEWGAARKEELLRERCRKVWKTEETFNP